MKTTLLLSLLVIGATLGATTALVPTASAVCGYLNVSVGMIHVADVRTGAECGNSVTLYECQGTVVHHEVGWSCQPIATLP